MNKTQLYFSRWIRLLFGREFPMQDLLALWDAIFADGVGFELVDFVFVAMLLYIRDLCKQLFISMSLLNQFNFIAYQAKNVKIGTCIFQLYFHCNNQDWFFFFYRQLKNWVIPLFSVLSSDYPQCLTCLMRYPPVPDIGYLIEKAQYLREPKVGVSSQFAGIDFVNAFKT